MLSSHAIDIVIYVFLGYSALVGFKRGLFNVLAGIFGIYGASIVTWLFQSNAYEMATQSLGLPSSINPSFIFIGLWMVSYFVIVISAKVLTGLFKLSGINFPLRVIGAILNASKAVLIVIVVLTLLTNINKDLLQKSDLTTFLVSTGSNVINIYHRTINEEDVDLRRAPEIIKDSIIIDDDFRYNLLER